MAKNGEEWNRRELEGMAWIGMEWDRTERHRKNGTMELTEVEGMTCNVMVSNGVTRIPVD